MPEELSYRSSESKRKLRRGPRTKPRENLSQSPREKLGRLREEMNQGAFRNKPSIKVDKHILLNADINQIGR